MKASGKIVFYNVNDGNGMIMTPDKGKFPFQVMDWDDYEQMPSVGLEVTFDIVKEAASSVRAISHEPQIPASYKEIPPQRDTAYRKRFDTLMQHYDERPQGIELHQNAQKCIETYFSNIERYIAKNLKYNNSSGRLDFLLMRRFILTTYNNLSEMDMNFVTPQITKIRDDLLQMSAVYDDFKAKNNLPHSAFETVFLQQQDNYVSMEKYSEEVSKFLHELQQKEQYLEQRLAVKSEEMHVLAGDALEHAEEEYRVLKGTYVDVVHMCATLSERLHEDQETMSEFRSVHKENFIESFQSLGEKYEKLLLQTLDAQAFIFDIVLWEKAKLSRVIKRFFSEAQIDGEFSSKTYLKYYLSSLDKEKLSEEQRSLFKLYEYLKKVDKYTTVILLDDIDTVLELKRICTRAGLNMFIKTFIDESSALVWALANRANLFILSDTLQQTSGIDFIEQYREQSPIRPKVMMVSNYDAGVFEKYGIDSVIQRNYTAKEMIEKLKKLLGECDG